MSKINRFRFPDKWDTERVGLLVKAIRDMGLDLAEELLDGEKSTTPLKSTLIAYLLKRKFWTLKGLSDYTDIPEIKVKETIDFLWERGYRVRHYENENTYRIHTKPFVEKKVSVANSEVKEELVLGVISDTHLGSKYAREDLLTRMYEHFKEEGVTEVLHAGNILDGYLQHINGNDVIVSTMEGQVQYAIDHYPHIDGITTYFISNDCHEGWWSKGVGIDVGKYIELSFKDAGRNDLVHLGYLAVDRLYNIKGRKEPFRVKIVHPKGGQSPLSDTAALQKVATYLIKQNEPQPDLLISGHFHKIAWTRVGKTFCMHAGSFQEGTPFMIGNSLLSRLGGYIVKIKFNANGDVLRFTPDLYDFEWAHDAEYVQNRRVSWEHKGF